MKTYQEPHKISLDDLRSKVDRLSKASGIPFAFIASSERASGRGYQITPTGPFASHVMPRVFRGGELGLTRVEANKTLDAMLAGIAMTQQPLTQAQAADIYLQAKNAAQKAGELL